MGNHPGLGERAEKLEDFFATPEDLEILDPYLTLGYFHRLELILGKCPIKIYAASSLKHPWPYRLQKAGDCHRASFWRSQHRILDSNILDPSLTNKDILDEAIEKKATAVVAKDYLPFDIYEGREFDLPDITGASNHLDATIQSIEDFVTLHDPDIHPTAYFPLQIPYDKHIREVRPIVQKSHLEERYMLGGLKDATPEERIQQTEALRGVVGNEPHLHGLGWGPSDTLVRHLRDNPGLIDSIDNSGPSQAIISDEILDNAWKPRPFGLVNGDFRNSVAGVFEFGMLLQAAHRFTTHNSDFDESTKQRELFDY
jgi:hypothetical protein